MGHKFSLVLSREVTDDESAILKDAGCGGAVFMTDSLPTNAEVAVTKMDFDDTVSPSLAEAIEAALEAVKKVPGLSVPGLTVPAQPAKAPEEETPAEEASVKELEAAADESTVSEKPAPKKKASARKATTKKSSAEDPVEAAVASD